MQLCFFRSLKCLLKVLVLFQFTTDATSDSYGDWNIPKNVFLLFDTLQCILLHEDTQSSVLRSKQWSLKWKSIVWNSWSSEQIHQRVWRAQRWLKLEARTKGKSRWELSGWRGPLIVSSCLHLQLCRQLEETVGRRSTRSLSSEDRDSRNTRMCLRLLLFISVHHSWTGN